MKSHFGYAIACAALLLSVAFAQDTSTAASSASQASNPQSTVYVYRYKQFVGKALSPSVFCDDNELARMENGRYFVVKLAPGKHLFHSNDKQAGVELDLKPGEKSYIRVEIATGLMKGHGRLVSVTPEQGTYEITKLKPLDSDKVKDTQHVTLVDLHTN
jgi:uncharacterized protein DUF2846